MASIMMATRLSAYERARAATAQTPFLALDSVRLIETYHALQEALPDIEIFYAIKANADVGILRLLNQEGASYDVASLGELNKVLALGVPGARVVCSNPIKNRQLLERCAETGVYAVVADSDDEVRKIAHYTPGARVYIRLAVDNSGAVMPLDKKFGVSAEQAIAELALARDLGLQPIGLAFHVGSQCVQVYPWAHAIQACGAIWRAAAEHGIKLSFLDLGGGYPVRTDPSVPTLSEIGHAITSAIAEYIPHTPDLRVIVEPGRGLVGEAGVMVMTVVGRAQRGDKTWLYLDGGVFHGMTEILEGFSLYQVLAEDENAPLTHYYTLAGPTCDSADTMLRDVALPETNIGDRLYILNTGAYSTEYATTFNGFDKPTVEIV
ncbi:MAG: type III PLP-dependent enzyme [Aggregatilineales bacterium]